MRRVFLLMSANALPYAGLCIRTMLQNSIDPIHLRILTDNNHEKDIVRDQIESYTIIGKTVVNVLSKEEVSDRFSAKFSGKSGLLALHEGHPCWRKIIDPLVLSEPNEEIIVVDPDLFFPNTFSFEETPQQGVCVMRQRPNCLFPPTAVRTAFLAGIRLANHVDIGVAQLSVSAVDIDWLDWIATTLRVQEFRSYMHIEAIIWSAMAMQFGGRHLDPHSWRCWERGTIKRLSVALGLPGPLTLRLEPLSAVKCIHLSGPSKWWIQDALSQGDIFETKKDRSTPSVGPDYAELTASGYEREQQIKRWASKAGLYRMAG